MLGSLTVSVLPKVYVSAVEVGEFSSVSCGTLGVLVCV